MARYYYDLVTQDLGDLKFVKENFSKLGLLEIEIQTENYWMIELIDEEHNPFVAFVTYGTLPWVRKFVENVSQVTQEKRCLSKKSTGKEKLKIFVEVAARGTETFFEKHELKFLEFFTTASDIELKCEKFARRLILELPEPYLKIHI